MGIEADRSEEMKRHLTESRVLGRMLFGEPRAERLQFRVRLGPCCAWGESNEEGIEAARRPAVGPEFLVTDDGIGCSRQPHVHRRDPVFPEIPAP